MTKFFYWVTKVLVWVFLISSAILLVTTLLSFNSDINRIFPIWTAYLSASISSIFFASISFATNKYVENIWYQELAEEQEYEEVTYDAD